MSKLSPLEVFNENLIVKKKRTDKTAGGIVLPDSDKAQRVGALAEVLACGKGRILDTGHVDTMPVSVGDLILVSGMAGFPLSDELKIELGMETKDSQDVYFVRQQDIIGRVVSGKSK